MSATTPVAATAGLALPFGATPGVFTASRREWPDWEPTSLPFSFIAYWYITTYASASTITAGNSGSTGYFIGELFGTGTRRYVTGGVTLQPGGVWPLNVPILSVFNYDGATISAYLNGASEGTQGGGAATSYTAFERVMWGTNPDHSYDGAGGVWYFGLANRIVTQAEALSLSLNPWQLFAPLPRRMWFDVTDNLFAQACL